MAGLLNHLFGRGGGRKGPHIPKIELTINQFQKEILHQSEL